MQHEPHRAAALRLTHLLLGVYLFMGAPPAWAAWSTFAGNPQHSAVSAVASQPLEAIHWSTPVDLAPPDGDILIHYGSPLITPANTVVLSVKTGSGDGYKLEARNALDGSLIWSQDTDYILPPHHWTPSYSPTLTPSNRLYFAGPGGTVYFRDNVDSSGPATTGQVAFFGLANYLADPTSFNSTVFVDTPITSDSAGNVYFGFRTNGSAPLGLQSGIARIDAGGNGTWISAVHASGDDLNITRVPHQAAPALSNDEQTLYAVVASSGTVSYVVGLDPTTLALKAASPGVKMRVALKDPRDGINDVLITDDSSASPMVGPDGDVYYGVLGNPFNGSRGWMLHFSGNLTQTKTPGAFGWDNTASIVPTSAVPSYTGTSAYLIFTKYNNYATQDEGDGVNRIAVLDPNDTMIEPHTSSNGLLVMKEVLTIAAPTPDPEFIAQFPNAVREWCINTAAVDPLTSSVMVNNEDGKLYRWDLTTNILSQVITLSAGIGEAYTPTLIGADGTVYAINGAILNAVGRLPAMAPTHTPTNPPTVSPTATNTAIPAPTETATNVPTNTSTLTPTPTATATKTPTNTPTTALTHTPTATGTPTVTATPTPIATAIHTATATVPRSATEMPTATQTRTSTASPTVTPLATPSVPNDPCAGAALISGIPYAATQTTSAATTDATDDPIPPCGGGSRAKSVWYEFTASNPGILAANTFGSTYDTILSAYTGGCLAPVSVGCNDDAPGTSQSQLSFAATAGTTYLFMITAYHADGGTLVFNLGVQDPTPTATPSFTQTQTPTNTVPPSSTPTPTRTRTASHTPTPSNSPSTTPTMTPTGTSTLTPTATSTLTLVPTVTQTQTATIFSTPTRTPTTTPTRTPTATGTPSNTPTTASTHTPTWTLTMTPTATATRTPSASATSTKTATATSTRTTTATHSPTLTQTPMRTATNTSTPSATRTVPATSTTTATRTPTRTLTMTPTTTATRTPSASATSTKTATATSTRTTTPTRSPTLTQTPMRTATSTSTPSATRTVPATSTTTATRTPTRTQTLTPTSTATRTPSSTQTGAPTQTPTGTETATLSSMATPTPPPISTATEVVVPTPPATPTGPDTPTYTATSTATPTDTATQPPTSTRTPPDTPTRTPTWTNTITVTPTATTTATSTPTVTPTGSHTPTLTLTATATHTSADTPTATSTNTFAGTPTNTPTSTPINTPTSAATSTYSATATPTSTSTIAPTPTMTASSIPTPTVTPENAATATEPGTPTRTPKPCVGDCNGDGEVPVNEVIQMVNIALDTADVSVCTGGDANGDAMITVNEIVAAVRNALNGCFTGS